MIMTDIDWKRCHKNLEKIFPELQKELDKGIAATLKTEVPYEILLRGYPPHISIKLHHEGTWVKDLKKSLPSIGDCVAQVAEKYGLKSNRGGYDEIIEKGEKKGFQWKEFEYVLKPYYNEYKAISIHNASETPSALTG